MQTSHPVLARCHLPLLSLVLLAAGCVGEIENARSGSQGGAPDAASPGSPDAQVTVDSVDAGDPDAARACDDPVGGVGAGEHKAGQACLTGCHTPTTSGPTLSIAGTLYDDAAGSAPVAGATIHVIDADDNELTLVTQQNGNFWISAPVVFPLRVFASRCPDSADKVTPVTAADDGGNCNGAGCHAAGFRIHLP